jgi:chromatin remodeling complex protein RSC6
LAAKKRRKTKAKSRRKTKAKSKRKTKAKKSKSKSKKKPFGGYAISFAGRTDTAEQIFGKKPVTPSEMTKKIWAFVKSRRLSNR